MDEQLLQELTKSHAACKALNLKPELQGSSALNCNADPILSTGSKKMIDHDHHVYNGGPNFQHSNVSHCVFLTIPDSDTAMKIVDRMIYKN